MSQIDNIIIQVRARLQALAIKLWLEPYYYEGVGCVEDEIEKLADSFSSNLGISKSNCKLALSELQEGALRKLAARKEFEQTGLATFSVRRINNRQGTQNIVEVKCRLKALGSELHEKIAQALDVVDPSRVKCISSGKIVNCDSTLESQGLKNNQQLMVIISEVDQTATQNHEEAMYDRIRKIKMDVEAIVDSSQQLFEMEDQDGNPVFLPPAENRALLMAMSYYEKARAAMKREQYDEALILLLESDEKFITCNSKFLEAVDNYALVNLDIVWCYLCLKNVTQLPDAQRRLDICEKSFRRSYGENLQRLITLKGNGCAEKALIMRLHLLQGVVLFHQNRRNEAYEKLIVAESELDGLKVDDGSVVALMEMGYEPYEARLGLRACNGNLEQAINFIHDRKAKLREARQNSKEERKLNAKLAHENNGNGKDWVNPRSVCTLMEMGYARDVVVEALKRTKNDVPKALDLLNTNAEELSRSLPPPQTADSEILTQLQQLGFTEDMARVALETTQNSLDKAIEFLIKTHGSETELLTAMERISTSAAAAASDMVANQDNEGPSTSSGVTSLVTKALDKAQKEIESLKAYKRFTEEMPDNEHDYLDLPLVQEEQILVEYKRLLEQ
ncbi:NEDD8 ultimate buster 1 [Musca vetustissima]|uniref:NEDD8 ultimate buster 1 n=1 Tax=Musca vetustissima TaxID=27455 RepID=UPI002AB72A55|nr:NEDD8 ultimate buster 1 [Musca vetustissima]